MALSFQIKSKALNAKEIVQFKVFKTNWPENMGPGREELVFSFGVPIIGLCLQV